MASRESSSVASTGAAVSPTSSSSARFRSRSSSTSPSRTSPRSRASQPKLVPKRRRPPLVDERAERPEVRAKPTCRDTRLVDALRIEIEPDDRVVADEADDGQRDRTPDRFARGRVRPQVGDGDLGREGCRRASARMYFAV